jgi:gliding motility-associated-like protein
VGKTLLRWTVSNGTCKAVTDSVFVERDSLVPVAEAGEDILTENFEINLGAKLSEGTQGTWEVSSGSATFHDPHDPSTLVSGLSPGKNVLVWTVREGACGVSSDAVTVELKEFMIPNAISPNGDGKNDRFHITGLENYHEVHLTIYNSWGGIVFEDRNYRNNWEGQGNGGTVPNDTYYYILQIPGKNNYTGFITVKR